MFEIQKTNFEIPEVEKEINKVIMTKKGVKGGCLLKQEYIWKVQIQTKILKKTDSLILKVFNKNDVIHQSKYPIFIDIQYTL